MASEDGLKNPMRFSIDRTRIIDIGEKLRHPGFREKRVTDIEVVNDQMCVHWEWADDEHAVCARCGDAEVDPERCDLTPAVCSGCRHEIAGRTPPGDG